MFGQLVRDIVAGVYAAGARLPAERDLARDLGASRPTVREALRRMTEWRLIEARRGSGITVRHAREWSIEVLGTYLRHGKDPTALALVTDMLALRRSLLCAIVERVAGRVDSGGLDLSRAALRRAWEHRSRPMEFITHDLEAMRHLVSAARFLPAVWLLNRLGSVYLDVARALSGALPPPDDYVAAHEAIYAAIEAGDGARARDRMKSYLERHDRRVDRTLAS